MGPGVEAHEQRRTGKRDHAEEHAGPQELGCVAAQDVAEQWPGGGHDRAHHDRGQRTETRPQRTVRSYGGEQSHRQRFHA